MKKAILFPFFSLLLGLSLAGQSSFPYTLSLTPVEVAGLPGLHSYAFGQQAGKWLLIGGRKDGVHARQPFNAFPATENNDLLYVVDVSSQQWWSAPLTGLGDLLQEQLQSTNMNFFQEEGQLYLIGGYAYSASAESHITFPTLTAIDVAPLIDAIIAGQPIAPYFQQIVHDNFAITGGQLGKIADTFYLVGGHRFDGRYNPMGGPSFSQTYADGIRKFKLVHTADTLYYTDYSLVSDPVHLHRRDYNLLAQILPDGQQAYTISAGVFQLAADLPFLYPVEIRADGHTPITEFNQYLSHYHSAKANLHDADNGNMHHLFFGGISQFYYQHDTLLQDDDVPFVSTISLLSRLADGHYEENKLPLEMPGLQGASAEFIPNESQLPFLHGEILSLAALSSSDTAFVIGHIFGGIHSNSRNPFAFNQTSTTSAAATLYEVRLHRANSSSLAPIAQPTAPSFTIYPNPSDSVLQITTEFQGISNLRYLLATAQGQLVAQGTLDPLQPINYISLTSLPTAATYFLTLITNDRYYSTHLVQYKP